MMITYRVRGEFESHTWCDLRETNCWRSRRMWRPGNAIRRYLRSSCPDYFLFVSKSETVHCVSWRQTGYWCGCFAAFFPVFCMALQLDGLKRVAHLWLFPLVLTGGMQMFLLSTSARIIPQHIISSPPVHHATLYPSSVSPCVSPCVPVKSWVTGWCDQGDSLPKITNCLFIKGHVVLFIRL